MKMIFIQNIFFLLFISCGMSQKDEQSIAFDYYFIRASSDINVKEVDYLYKHFKKRASNGVILKQGQDKIPSDESKVQFIDVAIEKNLNVDYEIIKNGNQLTLKAKSRKTLYWLYYQYFQALSENNSKISADDLPPAIVNFKESKKVKFAFDYREPHLKANLVEDYDVIVNTNNVENDWGIWGHQLFNLINKTPKNVYYSIIDGSINKNQLCFGKPEMYNFLVNFVLENYGEKQDSNQKFVVSPADNNLVCTCPSCSKLGNTKGNSSPAVISLVNKLANRFPNHQFFTIDYLSVKSPPSLKMPKNTGVLISSIDIPRKTKIDINNSAVKAFTTKIQNWHKVCPSVYVWDYISNFDDYLTPFATLSVCKSNFEYYKKLNVSGIFANGAGYDYSSFNEVHTFVLAALMQDPNLDVEQLVNGFCKQHYGDAGKLVADYIMGLEKSVESSNYSLDLYGGIGKMTKTYLKKDDFFNFYNEIGSLRLVENDDTKYKLALLHAGLTFSAMQINLSSGFDDKFGFAKILDNQIVLNSEFKKSYETFEEQFKIMEIYLSRERDGMLLNYLRDIKKDVIDVKLRTNLLSSNRFNVISDLDEDYNDPKILIDGIPGLPFDYHNGWLFVSAADFTAEIDGLSTSGSVRLGCNFLLDERLKLRAPEKLQVLVNNIVVKTIYPKISSAEPATKISLETMLNVKKDDNICLKIYRDKTFKKFACDEIYLYK